MKKLNMFNPQKKVIANIDKIIPFLDGDWKTPPVIIEMDPSNACNHGGRFCFSSYIHFEEFKGTDTFDRSVMSKEMMLNCIDQFDEMGVRSVNFTGGGDPTVNPNLKDLLYHTGESSLECGIFTNGAIMHRFDLFDAFVDNLEWVRFCVDAGSKEKYNWIRQIQKEDDWDQMLENLAKTIELKKKKNSSIIIGVGFVMTEDTLGENIGEEIVNFAEVFSKFDLDFVQYKPDSVNIKRWEREQYERDLDLLVTIEKYLDKAEDILGPVFQCQRYRIEDIKDGEKHINFYKKCLGSQIMPCVGADGHVYVCPPMRGMKEYSYGSLHEKSFIEIWGDIDNRKRIMKQIEEVECFGNCTPMCKPHETNKALWEMSQSGDYYKYLDEMEEMRDNVKHWKFI